MGVTTGGGEGPGELGTPRLAKYPLQHPQVSQDFNIVLWYRPFQTSNWLPHTPHVMFHHWPLL